MKINSGQAPSTLVPKYIGSDFDHVVTVGKNIEDVKTVAGAADDMEVVIDNLGSVATIATNIGDVVSVSDNMSYVQDVAAGIAGLPVISYIGEEPPTQPEVGSSWFCTTDGRTYVWYKDVDSYQWVESSPQSAPLDLQYVREVAIANTGRQMKLLGYELVNGSFEEGALLSKSTDVVLYKHTGAVYKWKGVFPAQIPANSTPTGTGITNWEKVDSTLREELAAAGGAGLVGIYQSNLLKETTFVSPEMYGAGDTPSLTDTQPLIDAFTAAIALGVSVKLSRLYRCGSNINLLSFISDLFGLGQGQTGVIFEPGFGFVIDNSAITGTRKAMRIVSTSIRTRGSLDATAVKFKGTSSAKYGEQLKITDVLFANDETGTFGWDCCVELDKASQVTIDSCNMTGLDAVPTNCCIRLKNSSRDVKFINGCAAGFTQFMDVTSSSEGITVAFNHIIAGRRGIVSHDTGGNMIIVIGNHFNTSLSVVELGEGTGAGSNHCKISDNFCIVYNHPLDAAAPYTGFDICSNFNQLTANEVLLTGFSKPNVIHTRLRGNTGATRFATANCVVNPLMNGLSQGIVIAAGATGNQIHGSVRSAMTLANDIVDAGTNTRYWLMDSDNNSLLTSDIKLTRLGASGTRQIRVHTAGDTNVADGILRFVGGTAGVANDGMAEFTFKETVTKIIRPSAGNTYTCGVSGAPWSGGFTQTAFTVTSDERLKVNIASLLNSTDEAKMAEFREMISAWREVDFFTYQFIDRVEKKGQDGARWHLGIIAQRAIAAFTKHGLDWTKYAIFNYDKWDAKPAIYDDDGGVIHEAIEAWDKYTINYEEALILESVSQRDRCDSIEARLSALEAR